MTRNLVKVLLAVLMAVPGLGLANDDKDQVGQVVVSRPNILILMAEDMSGRVGAFDDPLAVTPNLDKLSETENKKWVFKGAEWLRPDNKICLVYLSDGGKDEDEIREFDVETKEFVKNGLDKQELIIQC